MLDMNSSRIFQSEMGKLASDVPSVEEGTAMVRVLENGSSVVRPSAGAADENFAGIAQSQVINATVASVVEEATVPAGGGTVTLVGTPTADPVVWAGATRITKDTAAAAGKYSISGKTLTFASADAGKDLKIVYTKALTVVEAQALYGQGILDGAQSVIQATGLITGAEVVYTSKFDPASNWWDADGGPVYTGANGTISLADTGAQILRATVIEAPTPTRPFVGIRINS